MRFTVKATHDHAPASLTWDDGVITGDKALIDHLETRAQALQWAAVKALPMPAPPTSSLKKVHAAPLTHLNDPFSVIALLTEHNGYPTAILSGAKFSYSEDWPAFEDQPGVIT